MNGERCYVGSEIGQLRGVILHHSELSLKRLTPSNSAELLFDDVLRVEQAEKEHDYFCQILRNEKVEVFLLRNLLSDVLENEQEREWLLERQCSDYFLGPALAEATKDFLRSKNTIDMASYLIGGITQIEFKDAAHSLVYKMRGETEFILPPLPNHLFTRDTSCWIYDGVSINPMAKAARKRETVNLRAIYNFHPLFKEKDFNFWFGNSDKNYEHATLEGGDVLVIGNGLVVIGLGERSSPQGVELLAASLFSKGSAKKIVVVELPKARSAMHLDTVMTMLDYDCFTIYPPVMDNVRCFELSGNGENKPLNVRELKKNLFDYIADYLGTGKVKLIPTGGNAFEMEREQWNDANNVLTIRPGVVIGYNQNTHTLENMHNAGIHVHTIGGEELGRGRGGARCMSCPFDRDDL